MSATEAERRRAPSPAVTRTGATGTPGRSAGREAERLRAAATAERRPYLIRAAIAPALCLVAAVALVTVNPLLSFLAIAGAIVLAVRSRLFGLLRSDPDETAWRRQVAAETTVAKALSPLAGTGWCLLHDRQIPGYASVTNVDHLLVGPAGTFVVISTADAGSYVNDEEITLAVEAARHAGLEPVRGIAAAIKGARRDGWETLEGHPVRPATGLRAWLQSQPRRLDAVALERQATLAREAFPATGEPAAKQLDAGSGVPLAPLSEAQRDLEREQRDSAAVIDRSDPERLNKVLVELDALAGLESVAEQVRQMARRVQIDAERRKAGLAVSEMGIHAVFAGPPGTGKTTVARIWGRALAAVGRLPRGHVVEVERGDLVGQYIGETAQKTVAQLDRAIGGVLFIDEAYALSAASVAGARGDFGREAVETILTRMENEREHLCVIVAGYENEIEDLLASNPGLRSRFNRTIRFPDFDAASLVRIAVTMAAGMDYRIDDSTAAELRGRLEPITAAPPPGWANARSIRTLIDSAIDAQVDRLSNTVQEREREVLERLETVDFDRALREQGFVDDRLEDRAR